MLGVRPEKGTEGLRIFAVMDLGLFLTQLHESGRVQVGRDERIPEGRAPVVLRELYRATCFAGPAGLPEFDPVAALWAAEWFHAACQCFVHRDLGAAEVERRLGSPCPSDRTSPAAHLSVDLTLRHLPDLIGLVRGIAAGDPLLVVMRAVGRDWPLSSVGMQDIGDVDIDPLLRHGGLRVLYVDRVLAAKDAVRAQDERVRRALAGAYGEHMQLARGTSREFDSPPPSAAPR